MPMPVFVRTARNLTILALLALVWCAALWFGIAPDFSAWSAPRLATVHAVPPLLVWSVWTWLQRRRQQRNAARAVRKEELAEQERKAALEAARQQHAAEQQRLHFGCDCRALAMTDALLAEPMEEPWLPAGEAIHFSAVSDDTLAVQGSLLDHLRPGIEQALGAVYAQCSAFAHFPVFVAPPPDVAGEEVLALVREIRSGFLAKSRSDSSPILFLPVRECAADSLIGLFESAPDLPGAVVLAFDSPWWRAGQIDSNAGLDDAASAQQRWLGKPAQAALALFVAHPSLDEMLANLTRQQHPHDQMTPYWEKLVGSSAVHSSLASLSDLEHEGLQRQPRLARIHRAASAEVETGSGSGSRSDLAQNITNLIERAQINAAQIELAFAASSGDLTESSATDSSSESGTTACHWLVHNVGNVDCGGPRLASLGVALFKRGFDLDPIESATNVTVTGGDLGQARSLSMLALAVAKVAEIGGGKGAALCAEFNDQQRLALYFAQTPAVVA